MPPVWDTAANTQGYLKERQVTNNLQKTLLDNIMQRARLNETVNSRIAQMGQRQKDRDLREKTLANEMSFKRSESASRIEQAGIARDFSASQAEKGRAFQNELFGKRQAATTARADKLFDQKNEATTDQRAYEEKIRSQNKADLKKKENRAIWEGILKEGNFKATPKQIDTAMRTGGLDEVIRLSSKKDKQDIPNNLDTIVGLRENNNIIMNSRRNLKGKEKREAIQDIQLNNQEISEKISSMRQEIAIKYKDDPRTAIKIAEGQGLKETDIADWKNALSKSEKDARKKITKGLSNNFIEGLKEFSDIDFMLDNRREYQNNGEEKDIDKFEKNLISSIDAYMRSVPGITSVKRYSLTGGEKSNFDFDRLVNKQAEKIVNQIWKTSSEPSLSRYAGSNTRGIDEKSTKDMLKTRFRSVIYNTILNGVSR